MGSRSVIRTPTPTGEKGSERSGWGVPERRDSGRWDPLVPEKRGLQSYYGTSLVYKDLMSTVRVGGRNKGSWGSPSSGVPGTKGMSSSWTTNSEVYSKEQTTTLRYVNSDRLNRFLFGWQRSSCPILEVYRLYTGMFSMRKLSRGSGKVGPCVGRVLKGPLSVSIYYSYSLLYNEGNKISGINRHNPFNSE